MINKQLTTLICFASIFITNVTALLCECNSVDSHCHNSTCETDGLCIRSQVKNRKFIHNNLDCLDLKNMQPVHNPMHCHGAETSKHYFAVECCSEDFCNRHLSPQVVKLETAGGKDKLEMALMISVPLCILTVLICCLVLYYQVWNKTRTSRKFKSSRNKLIKQHDFEINKLLDEFSCSGSGAGLPLLVQRTIARQIQTEVIIGKGRYGEVWRGKWRGEAVAVKIFHTLDEQSWARETQIYQTNMLRHQNVLGFIASDNKDNGTWTQLWLVTDYYENGSLYDYLNECAIMDVVAMLRMAESIIAGLSHLHIEIFGTQGKPAIAHRDLKSKNILVKNDGTCCIADLGLAVKHYSANNEIDVAENTRIGTSRYLAPEALDGSMNFSSFDSYKMVDVYALALILWEISNRTVIDDEETEYAAPYHDEVTPDPSIEVMRKVVCIQQIRPKFSEKFEKNKSMKALKSVIEDSWSQLGEERLSLLRLKKRILSILIDLDVKKELC